MYKCTKTYGHDLGLSACFRQHRAESHCRFLHGYPLSFKFTFQASELDKSGWVINFGGLKGVKQWLTDTFDHRLIIAFDDPEKERLLTLGLNGLACPIVVPDVGCEAFACLALDFVQVWLDHNGHSPRVQVIECEVREHGGNSAIYGEEYNAQ